MANKTVVYTAKLKDDTKRGAKSVEKSIDQTSKSVSKSISLISGAVGALGIAKLASDFVKVNKEFQSLNASLITVTGSTEAANKAFANLEQFAKNTPFQLSEVVKGFAKMKALGLDPTNEAMTSFGNTASSMSLGLNQMIEAVADAATGEFERLKEFGIKASKQGEEITFTFQGVKTTVRNDAAAIQDFLVNLGNTKFAGGMARQMDTLGGALSNLSDNYDALWRNVGSTSAGANLTDAVKDFLDTISSPAFISGMSIMTQAALALVAAAAAGVSIVGMASPRGVNIQDDNTQKMLMSSHGFGGQGIAPQMQRSSTTPAGVQQVTGPNGPFLTPQQEFERVSSINQERFNAELIGAINLKDMLIIQAEDRVAVEDRANQAILANEEAARNLRLQGASNLQSQMATLAQSGGKAGFEISKIYNLSKAVMDGKSAVLSSYKWGASWGGPPGGAAMAGIALAATASQIASIASAQYGGKGSVGTITGTGGGTTASPIVTQPVSQNQQPQQGITFVIDTLIGNDEWAENNLIPLINSAGRRNVTIDARSIA